MDYSKFWTCACGRRNPPDLSTCHKCKKYRVGCEPKRTPQNGIVKCAWCGNGIRMGANIFVGVCDMCGTLCIPAKSTPTPPKV